MRLLSATVAIQGWSVPGRGTAERWLTLGSRGAFYRPPVARKFPARLRHLIKCIFDDSADVIAGSLGGKIADVAIALTGYHIYVS